MIRLASLSWLAPLLLGTWLGAGAAWGQGVASERQTEAWSEQARAWVEQRIQPEDDEAPLADAEASPQASPAGPALLRPEVELGRLDSRLQLAPCDVVEPFLPTGSRLWGRSRIGLRCLQGAAHWQVFLPITVKAWGPAWVVTRPVAPGQTLTQDDAELAEIDWASGRTTVLVRPSDWVGQTAARAMMPGQAIRRAMVRPQRVFDSGDPVRVTVVDKGFRMSASGKALQHGLLGQDARVRLPNGRVITGVVRGPQTVELLL